MTDAYIYDHVRTPRGRVACAKAYEHLGLEAPKPATAVAPDLFGK